MSYRRSAPEPQKPDLGMAVAPVFGMSISVIAVLGSVFGVFQQFSSLQADNKLLKKQIKQVDDKLDSFGASAGS